MICISCQNNLNLLSNFKNICIKSDETVKLRLTQCSDLKREEIILDDLVWQNEFVVKPNIYNSTDNNAKNERKSENLKKSKRSTVDQIELVILCFASVKYTILRH